MTNEAKLVTTDTDGNPTFHNSLEDAANEILSYDGYQYDIRPEEDGGFRLWISTRSGNAYGGYKMIPSVAFSLETDKDAARAEIFERVCFTSWDDRMYCQPVDEYKDDLERRLLDIDEDDLDHLVKLIDEAERFEKAEA